MVSVIPLEVVEDPTAPGAAEIYVVADVAGRSYRFLLDTGAASSRVAADAHTSALDRVDTDDEEGRGALGAGRPLRRVNVPTLTLGGAETTDLAMELASGPDGGPECILGLDVLGRHRLDFRLGRAELAIDGVDPVEQSSPLVLSSRRHPYVEVEWEGASARAVWDSGAGVSVVDRAFARAHPHLFADGGQALGIDAHGNAQDTPMVAMAGCRIGGREFEPTVAALADIAGIQRPGDPAFEMILGHPVIAQADWSIDLRAGHWGFLARDDVRS